jgi:hypothetical protein
MPAMLIIGAGLIVSAITVFLAWRVILACQQLWRTRSPKRPTK